MGLGKWFLTFWGRVYQNLSFSGQDGFQAQGMGAVLDVRTRKKKTSGAYVFPWLSPEGLALFSREKGANFIGYFEGENAHISHRSDASLPGFVAFWYLNLARQ